MSNHGSNANLIVVAIDKGGVNEKTLQSILEHDSDFSENEEYFREDTLKKGFENEAERVSTEIFKKLSKLKKFKDDEEALVDAMIRALFKVNNFIGQSGNYGNYTFAITETDFQYVVSIAYVGN